MDIIDDMDVSFYVHRRDGNKKRKFVLVNKNLAKHYPCVAADTVKMCRQLAEKSLNNTSVCWDTFIIAFAETATALGIIAAERLTELSPGNNVFLITTTREDLGKGLPILEFQEEHSHASRQFMYFGNKIEEKLNSCTRLVIIDDELSTGITILNLVDNIEKKCRLDRFASVEAWSLLNGMGGSDKEKYKSKGIKLVYLEEVNKPEIENHASTLDTNVKIIPSGNNMPAVITSCIELNCGDVRCGVDVPGYTKELKNKLEKAADGIMCNRYNAVDVIGTEECIYPAVVMADLLSHRFPDTEITCHSTTRSPIVAGGGALLSGRTGLASLYDSERDTYIYNMAEMHKDTLAVVVTDAACSTEMKEQFAVSLGDNVVRVEFVEIGYCIS